MDVTEDFAKFEVPLYVYLGQQVVCSFSLCLDREVLRRLRDRGVLVKTPSRATSEGTVASYDDRFILKLAASKNGVVVSNDHFRDLLKEEQHRQTIEKRILPFTFYSDT